MSSDPTLLPMFTQKKQSDAISNPVTDLTQDLQELKLSAEASQSSKAAPSKPSWMAHPDVTKQLTEIISGRVSEATFKKMSEIQYSDNCYGKCGPGLFCYVERQTDSRFRLFYPENQYSSLPAIKQHLPFDLAIVQMMLEHPEFNILGGHYGLNSLWVTHEEQQVRLTGALEGSGYDSVSHTFDLGKLEIFISKNILKILTPKKTLQPDFS